MLFWFTTIIRYLFTVVVAFSLSVALSLLVVVPFVRDDSIGYAFLWFMVLFAIVSFLTPLSLGITAELIQRKVLARRFEWPKALLRSLAALPAAVGPLYAVLCVFPYRENRRPTHWVEKEILLYSLSIFFAYVALRIKKPAAQPTPR